MTAEDVRSRVCATRSIVAALVLFLPASHSARAQPPESVEVPKAASLEDWTRLVPGDVRFYVELRDLRGMRERFLSLGIWQTVRDLAEGPAAAETPRATLSQSLLSLSADEAVTDVLGRRSALLATSSVGWQRGVLLADMGDQGEARRLLARLAAEPLTEGGPVRRYLARGGILVAQRGALLILGPAKDPEGLWERTVSLADGKLAPSLQARSEFASLRGRLARDHDGLIYASWPGDDPFAFAGCQRLLAAFKFEGPGLRAEIHGQRESVNSTTPTARPIDVAAIRALPADTLAAWFGGFDAGALTPSAASGDRKSLPAFFAAAFSSVAGGEAEAARRLGPGAALVVASPARSTRPGAFSLPAVTVLCEAREPVEVVGHLDAALRFMARVVAERGARPGEPAPQPAVAKRRIDGLEIHSLPLGRLLARRLDLDLLADVEACWAAADGRLLVSTSAEHMARIRRAKSGRSRTLEKNAVVAALLPDENAEAPLVEWALLRGRETSLALGRALQYIGRTRPEALRDGWWRDWAAERLRRRARLGIALRDSADLPAAAEVIDIEFDSPAIGVLQAGDLVLACEGQPLDAAAPARDVAQRYDRRGDDNRFALTIRRKSRTLDVDIVVPREPALDVGDLAPIQAMHRMRMLLQRVEAATLERRGLDPDRLDLELRIRWHQPGPPR